MRLLSLYHDNVIAYDLVTKFNIKKKKLPRFSKFVISFHSSNISLINLLISSLSLDLISNQKSHYILSKVNHNLNIKVKSGFPTGCKVTLRKKKMMRFISNLFITNDVKNVRLNAVNFKESMGNNIHFCISDLTFLKFVEDNYFIFRELSKIKVSIAATNVLNVQNLLFMLSSFKILKKNKI